MKYNVEIKLIETTDGLKWIAKYPALKGVMGGGDTQAEALAVLEQEAQEMIKFLTEEGEVIPQSDLPFEPKKYNGRMTYRPGPRRQQEIEELAERSGMSQNAIINDAVSRYLSEENIYDRISDQLNEFKKNLEK